MKIALGSDLHLEFGPLAEIRNREAAAALILSGDILVAAHFRDADHRNRADRYHEFFDRCEAEFGTVIYVMGNHEHYDGDFQRTLDLLREELDRYPGVHVLEKSSLTHAGVTFVGATLWTDFNRRDPLTMWEQQRRMNDYRCVTNGPHGARLLPQDTAEDHDWALAWIDRATQDTAGCYVVVGHHAPSRQSIKPRYATDHLMNGSYNSDLEEFIRARPQIRLWTHGHTHDDFDYRVGSTRVVCNPRGYAGYESRTEGWDFMYIDV